MKSIYLTLLFFNSFFVLSQEIQETRLALLGQSIIEHDPRDYYENPLLEISEILSDCDVVFTNLEVAINNPDSPCDPARTDISFHGAESNVLDFLKSIHVNLLSLSNNHSWDYGLCGINSTLSETNKKGFIRAGSGINLNMASAPVIIERNGAKFALISMASISRKNVSVATDSSAGINYVDVHNMQDQRRIKASILEARHQSDIVIVYQHYQSGGTLEDQENWARKLIDWGADIYVSHGSPSLSGIEIYNGKYCFYNLGNFIFHTHTPIGHYDQESWQGMMVILNIEEKKITGVDLYAVELFEGDSTQTNWLNKRGFPKLSSEPMSTSIFKDIQHRSQKYNTELEILANRAVLVNK